MSNSYWNKRLDAIPRGQSRKTGNNERTAYLLGMNWLVTRYHDTNIVIVMLDDRTIHLSTDGWDTVSTCTHMTNVIERVAREYAWAPYAYVARNKGVMHIQVMGDSLLRPISVFRLQGEWGVHVG